jgi:hypothetical protein
MKFENLADEHLELSVETEVDKRICHLAISTLHHVERSHDTSMRLELINVPFSPGAAATKLVTTALADIELGKYGPGGFNHCTPEQAKATLDKLYGTAGDYVGDFPSVLPEGRSNES